MSITNTSSTDGKVTVNFDQDSYAIYQQWIADTKKRNVTDKLKEMGLKVGTRRQTLIMRRVKDKIKTIAPDEDIAAYGEIHKLKNPTSDSKQKTYVSDNEIAAYKVLDPEFKAATSLEVVTAKVEEMIAAGELTKEGDVAEDDDESVGAEE